MNSTARTLAALTFVSLLVLPSASAAAEEKLVLLDDVPRSTGAFEVAADGSRIYVAGGGSYFVFDAAGKLVDKFGLPDGSARDLVPLPNGWFIAFNASNTGHISLLRPDGTTERKIVTNGGDEKHLRADMTGWTSPCGGAVDYERKLIFALDVSMAPRDVPDPYWSRIAIFDFDGKYVGDINRYDGKDGKGVEVRRTWYDDIEVDPARQRVYVTARRTKKLLAFAYDGKVLDEVPGVGGIAVFPDGRVAVCSADGKGVRIYDADLKPLQIIPLAGAADLEADAAGRLYASVNDPTITFIRWSADLGKREEFGPRYTRITVGFPVTAAEAGEPLEMKVAVTGRPVPAELDAAAGLLRVRPPVDVRGFHELAIRFGGGPISLADRQNDLALQKTFAFLPEGSTASVAVVPAAGRLYAVAPAALGPPRITAGLVGRDRDVLRYEIGAEAASRPGWDVPARVPLRIRLLAGGAVLMEIYRGTDEWGRFTGTVPVPATGKALALEVTELLGGRGSRVEVGPGRAVGEALAARPDVEPQRREQLRGLLAEVLAAGKPLPVVVSAAGGAVLTDARKAKLTEALKGHGIDVEFRAEMPKDPVAGTYLFAGCMPEGGSMGEALTAALRKGLFDWTLTANVPGPGRGFFTALFAPRGRDENLIALVGGDAEGLGKALDAFAAWLATADSKPPPAPLARTVTGRWVVSSNLWGPGGPAATAPADLDSAFLDDLMSRALSGKPADVPAPPKLSEMCGVRLDGVRLAAGGKHLLVTAAGYLRNLAVVEDRGSTAAVTRAVRVGQAPTVESPFISSDGGRFAASARTVQRAGQVLHLVDAATGEAEMFAGFGDVGRLTHHFAVSDDGATVLAPGTYGVVCWKRQGAAWREAWAIDYWKQFPKLDWPVSDLAERIPQFHAYIPRGAGVGNGDRHRNGEKHTIAEPVPISDADYAVIVFGELSNQGWVTPDNACTSHVAAVDLATGKERWRFDVPIFKSLLLPTLHASDDGSQLLLQVQIGSWNKETFRFFRLDGGPPAAQRTGKAAGTWNSRLAPQAVAVADRGGRVALAFAERLLEVRQADGSLAYNMYWRSQPVSVAFAADGQSLYVADDAGRLTCLDAAGAAQWQAELGCTAKVAAGAAGVYAACWDGRLRAYGPAGAARWTLDCTPALLEGDPMAAAAAGAAGDDGPGVVRAVRPATTVADVPAGDNLLRTGAATLTLGGIKGWISDGKVLVKPEALTNGRADDVTTPWLHLDEVFWDATSGRQVWAEITFKQPTDVKAVTVRENAAFPASWPTEGLVQVWNEPLKRWDTAAFGVFLTGPVNTYKLDLKGVTKLRYLPWNS